MEKLNKSRAEMIARRDVLGGAVKLAATYGMLRTVASVSDARADTVRTDLKLAIGDAQVKETLDPALSEITNSHVLVGAIYDHLVRFDGSYNMEPRLATRWERSADGREWKFYLRSGVRWHDGRPFTAEDVAYTANRLVDKATGSDLFTRLSTSIDPKGIKIIDDHQIVFTLLRPDSLLPLTFGARQSAIVPIGFPTRTTDISKAIGCGPFKLKSFTPGRGWEAERNDDYYGGKPKLERVSISVIPEQATKLQAVISGNFDACDAIQPSLAKTITGNKDVTLARLTADRMMTIVLDQTQKPFDDNRVRMALKRAFDRQKLLNLSYLGFGEVSNDIPVPPNDPLYPKDVNHSLDVALTKRLLTEAGFPNGIDLELNTSESFGGMVDLAVAFSELVKPTGIRVTVKQHPPSTYWDQIWLKAPMYVSYFTTRHAADRLPVEYGVGSRVNEFHFNNPKLEAGLAQALAAAAPEEQKRIYQDLLRLVANESGAIIPFFIDKLCVGRSNVDLKIVLETQFDLAATSFKS